MKVILNRWVKKACSVAISILMILLALFAITRIYYLVGYGYELLDYPHTGILHEYYYMHPYVLELRILTNWMIIVGVFCYFLKFNVSLFIFAAVLFVKLIDIWIPSIFSGRVLFVPGDWPYKFIPTIFWLGIVIAVYFRLKKSPI